MRAARRRIVAVVSVAILAIANLATQRHNVSRTFRGEATATMLQRLATLQNVSLESPVLLDIPEAFGALLAANYARGHVTVLLSGAVPSPADGLCDSTGRPSHIHRVSAQFERLACEWRASYRHVRFELGAETDMTHQFLRYQLPDDVTITTAVLVASASDRQVINNSWERPADGGYHVQPLSRVRNHLVEVDSSIAHTVTPGVVDNVALWPYEPDFANRDAGIQGVGRHLLFEVLNPVPDSHILMDFTAGGLARDAEGLPPVEAIGEGHSGFDFVGRGAGRMVSGAILPRAIDGHTYVAIDMGMTPLQFTSERTGILGLYNSRLGLDPRSLVGFVRNISLLTESKIADMAAPAAIDGFPRGLFAPGLLFSGIYEDGWMAEIAKLRLGAPGENRELRIRGSLPALPSLSGTVVEVRVDGEPMLKRRIEPGDFELRATLSSSGTHWIEIRADRVDRLPAPDGRVASLLLRSVGFDRSQ